jgi:hypothetical protein
MDVQLIPLGIRCNAAIVTNAIVNQPRLPFDWAQMNVNSMIDVLQLKKEHVNTYWTNYFSFLDKDFYHTQTKSWFPHDDFSNEEKEKTVEKYERRTNRLIDVLDSPIPKVFHIFFGYPDHESLEKANSLILAIRSRITSPHIFLICNAQRNEFQLDNVYFFYEVLPEKVDIENEDSWSILTKNVEKRVREFLVKLHVEPISFENVGV